MVAMPVNDYQTKERSVKNENQTSGKIPAGLPSSFTKKNTVMIVYQRTLGRFRHEFGEKATDSVTSYRILEFLKKIREGTKL